MFKYKSMRNLNGKVFGLTILVVLLLPITDSNLDVPTLSLDTLEAIMERID